MCKVLTKHTENESAEDILHIFDEKFGKGLDNRFCRWYNTKAALKAAVHIFAVRVEIF